ncbi:cytochrome c [Methyloceanibacter sp.]|uniref:c-type cytochrome n=1 Tax=Methyloceanibacter sp. TaxID=1965321 RepID=UPI002C778E8F|nr:cytochrome c [Methyloceanibacter sp.]HML93005.1 cytochrome c [Methyloceanibacter sp.]
MSDLASARVARPWLIALCVGLALLAAIGAAASAIYWGLYNVAADVPHSQSVFRLLEVVRDRSIAVRAAHVEVPTNLSDSERVALGAGQYAEMCSSCHLAPGMKRTEISRGLYPRAPELRRGSRSTPGEDFWVVKHGIKATGMPAWGVTHNDELLWNIVAFLRKLPDLSSDEYQALVKSAPKTHDEMMEEMEMGDGHGGHTTE